MNKKLSLFFGLFIALIAVSALVAAWTEPTADIKDFSVYVGDELVWYGHCDYDSLLDEWDCNTWDYATPAFERGEEVDIRVTFTPDVDYMDEVSVRAWLTGYKDDIEDETSEFDIYANHSYTKHLYLDIPEDADATYDYTLRVEIESQVQLTGVSRAEILSQIQHQSNDLEIKHVELYGARDYCSCSYEQITMGICGECNVAFEAGSTVCVDVTVRNRGSQEVEDVYVNVEVSALCIFKSAYLGDVDPDGGDDDSAEETVCFVIPEDTKAGTYSLEIEVEGDDASDSVSQSFNVIAAEEKEEPSTEAKVDVMLQQTSATVEQGEGAVYSFFVANLGEEQTFVISVEGIDNWATAQVNPQVFTLGEDESKTVNVYLAVSEDAVPADHVFTVKVKYGDNTKVYNFSTNVTEKANVFSGLDLKTILMIAAIVLAVIIVILLIVLLAKKGGSSKTEETYY